MNAYEVLKERGFIEQLTHEEEIKALFEKGRRQDKQWMRRGAKNSIQKFAFLFSAFADSCMQPLTNRCFYAKIFMDSYAILV